MRSALFAAALGAVATLRLHPGWRLTDVTRSADLTRCVVGVAARGAPTVNRVATDACIFVFVFAWGFSPTRVDARQSMPWGGGRYPPLCMRLLQREAERMRGTGAHRKGSAPGQTISCQRRFQMASLVEEKNRFLVLPRYPIMPHLPLKVSLLFTILSHFTF